MFFKVESYKKGLALSTMVNLIAKVLSFANNLVIAYFFGANFHTDIYFYVVSLFSFIGIFITGVSTSVIIPQSMRIREEIGHQECISFLNKFWYIFLFIGIIFTTLFCFAPVFSFSMISKYPVEILKDNVDILFIGSAIFPLIISVNYFSDILISYKVFTAPMIVSGLNSLAVIVFIVFFHSLLGARTLIIGTSAAYFLNLMLLIYLLKVNIHWKFSFSQSRYAHVPKKVWHDMLYSQIGNIFSILGGYLPIYLLSAFGSGVISSINYAQKIANIPIYIISSQFALVLGVKFNELFSRKQHAELNLTYQRALQFILFAVMPFSVFSFFFSEPIVNLLYNRGAFSASALHMTTVLLKYFSLPLTFLALNSVYAYLCFSAQIIKYSFLFQIVINFIQILLLFFLVKHIGYIGYPISIFLAMLLAIFLFPVLFRKLLPNIQLHTIYPEFLKILMLNVLLMGGIYMLLQAFALPDVAILVLAFALYLPALLFINHVFHINEDVVLFINRIFALCRQQLAKVRS